MSLQLRSSAVKKLYTGMAGTLATIIQHAVLKTRVKPRPVPSLFCFPGLASTQPFYNKDTFPIVTLALQQNFQVILDEYMKLHKSDYKYYEKKINLHHGEWDWNSYILKGERQGDFAAACPKTVEILESFKNPFLMTDCPFAYAFFSSLGAGAKIDPHHGPTNLRIRCHFPLKVPKGDVGIEVGGEIKKWQEGEPIFFDDAYEHRTWNNTTDDRVVLLFDMWHPNLSLDEIQAIREMFELAKVNGWLSKK